MKKIVPTALKIEISFTAFRTWLMVSGSPLLYLFNLKRTMGVSAYF
ncbi:hypothetical protein ACR1PO_15680 [Chryseobacterium sp. RRHN12]